MKAEPSGSDAACRHPGGLRQELGRLGERVAALEAAAASPAPAGRSARREHDGLRRRPPAGATPAHAPSHADGLDEELVLVISAAIAAFLGKKAHIRQISLVGSGVWAQQGRVTIQASHALSVHSARARLETQNHG